MQSYLSTHDRDCSTCSGQDSSDYHELLELNRDFTDTEVREEINQAPNGKAHRVDRILNEAIKAFNTIFSNCLFPNERNRTNEPPVIIVVFLSSAT